MMVAKRSLGYSLTLCFVLSAFNLLTPIALPSSEAAASVSSAPSSWSEGACPTSAGVTVVIDFNELGGGVYVRCTETSPANGLDALKLAGITYKTAAQFSNFVCRIANKPESDPCITTSPANAYWSYWVAPRSGSWCYSTTGAAGRQPPAGTVEGWSFAKDKSGSALTPPRFTPPPAVAGSPRSIPGLSCSAPAVTTPPTTAASVSNPTTAKPKTPTTVGSSNSNTGGGTVGTIAPASSGGALPSGAGGSNQAGNSTGNVAGNSPGEPNADGSTEVLGNEATKTSDADSADSKGDDKFADDDKNVDEVKDNSDGDGSSDEGASENEEVEVNSGGVDLASAELEPASSPTALLGGLAAIALVAGTAFVMARRRNQSSGQAK